MPAGRLSAVTTTAQPCAPESAPGPGVEIPGLAFAVIPRRDLYERIDRALPPRSGHVLLMSGPAGTGKTVLAAQWADLYRRLHPDTIVAWLTLTPSSAGAECLWPALRTSLGLTGEAPLDVADPTAEAAALVEAVAALGTPTLLVLDDTHVVTDQLALAGLEHLLHHAPANLTVIVIGRYDPPLRWHTLAMTGHLARVGTDDLALRDNDIADLFRQHDCTLSTDEIATISHLTGGWAALVRIAAIYLAAHTADRAAAMALLAHSPRAVSDFLVGELLDAVPPETREFLVATSIPDSFDAALAEEIAGPDALRILGTLERTNFPITHVVRGSDTWYSYHPMLRSHLLAELQRTDPSRAHLLHDQVARWFLAAGLPIRGLPHLLAQAGHPHLADFVRDYGLGLVLSGEGPTLFRYLDVVPDVSDDPFVWLLRTINALEHARPVEAATYLELLRARDATASVVAPPPWISALTRAVGADIHTATGAEIRDYTPGAPIPSTGHLDLDCYIHLQLATAQVFHGEFAAGEEGLRAALALAEQTGHPHLSVRATTRLAMAAGISGSISTMRTRAVRAQELAADLRSPLPGDAAHAASMAALAAYLQADHLVTETLTDALVEVARADGSAGPAAGWHAHIVAQLVLFDQAADKHAATRALRTSMHTLLDETPNPAASGGLFPHVTWVLLRQCEHEWAQQLVEHGRRVLGDPPDVAVALAAVTAAAARPQAALSITERLLDRAEELHPVTATTAWLLHATASDALGRRIKAYHSLTQALARASQDQLIRPFLDAPGALDLLDGNHGRFGHHDRFANRILEHRRATAHHAGTNLTDTELLVLRQLPAAKTAKETADDLGVSVNTVKTHLRGIYAKLGVGSRREAVVTARRVGLL
ncbi:LuxR C-terminal-related transcriptional regulator [Rhodococcus sp. NPDC003318]|uniref:LuxR C-terminal-related transcriptional regulator n=1 Tax=Rhodococcus sp. NPDC003318 TaxID=3364503 RepID=UPI0036A9BBAF